MTTGNQGSSGDHESGHAAPPGEWLDRVERAAQGLDARIRQLELVRQVMEVTAFVQAAGPLDGPLVSVILSTRNRSSLVPRAIESVVAQTYPTWELIAVDDGSDDDTLARLEKITDPRVRVVHSEHHGLAAARNRALALATGEYVAYIDDDNTMHPEWLRAVVWAFETWPDTEMLYGATLVDDDVARAQAAPRGLPWIRFVPSDRDGMRRQNPTDIGSMAHRRDLAEATFDEDLPAMEDWDLLLRVAERCEVLALPVLAGVYSTSEADRMTGSPAWDDALARMRTKHGLTDAGTS